MRPLAIDLYCGLGGWTAGLLAAGYDVVGFDIERHQYGDDPYPAQLVLQDVRTIDGAQFRDAALIVASPLCQEYSYMAMPWTRAKQIAAALRGLGDFPDGYKGSRTIEELNDLFRQCFRIQAEASKAAGRRIPLVVENVKGAQPWVGKAAWNFGSYYLWGDVPALMPVTMRAQKQNPDGTQHGQGSWFAVADSKDRGSKNAGGSWFNVGSPGQKVVAQNPVHEGVKAPGMNWSDQTKRGQDFTRLAGKHAEGVKVGGGSVPGEHRRIGEAWRSKSFATNAVQHLDGVKQRKSGRAWFADPDSISGATSSKSSARKAASARIAKISFTLSHWIARTYCPTPVLVSSQRRAG